jgi:PAS domain S-box-containing protein
MYQTDAGAAQPVTPRPYFQILARIAGVALAYFLAARLGLFFRTEPEKFAIFWPPNGLLLGLLMVSEQRNWRHLVLVAALTCVFANWLQGDSLAVCIGFALVNMTEPCLIAWLWRRLRAGSEPIGNASEAFLFYAGALLVCCITAVPGAAVVVFGLGAPDYAAVWLAFWLSDAMGVMLVTPLLLTWSHCNWSYLKLISIPRAIEATGLFAALIALTFLIFARPATGEHYLLSYAFPVFPLLLWAALRFGPPATTSAILVVSLIAIWNTGQGRGLFADPSVPATQRLLLVQLFLSVLSLSALALAGALAERQRVQEALRDSEERYRQMAETIDEIIWVILPDMSRVEYVSPAYERIWGRTCASLYENTQSYYQAIHPEDRERVLVSTAKLLDGQYNEEFRIVCPDGTIRWIHVRGFPLRDERGAVRRIVGISQDVTDRKEAELAKATLIKELQQALAEIKTLRGLVPICAWCKKIRDDAGFWQRLEDYLRAHTEWEFTHGVCPDCLLQQFEILKGEDPHAQDR